MLVRGQQIRTLREERGYTLRELANRANLSLSYLSEIERGSKCPSLKTVDKLARALDVPRSGLVENEQWDRGLSIGDKIRLLRKERKMSLADLAHEVGISTSYLSEIERGTVYPSLFILKQLARGVGVPPLVLMGYEGSLGHKLKMLREGYGMTQAELARKAGVTAGLIGQIEHAKVHPSLKTLEKLALATGVSPCYFVLEPGAVDQLIRMMNPELWDLLLEPNTQAVLSLVCNLNQTDLQFILKFIQLYKQSKPE